MSVGAPRRIIAAPPLCVAAGVTAMPATVRATTQTALLGPRERALAAAISHDRRRREFICGRLLAKWLLRLYEERLPGLRPVSAWPPPLWSTNAGALDAEWCRTTEVVRAADGSPRLGVHEGVPREPGLSISIAHSGSWVAAGVSDSARIGVDVEQVAARGAAFYRGCLTARERAWIGARSGHALERLATLLWVLKEASFKSGAVRVGTVWEMGVIDLDIATSATALLAGWPAPGAPSLESLRVRVRVSPADPWRVVGCAFGTTVDAVVGLVVVPAADAAPDDESAVRFVAPPSIFCDDPERRIS